MTVHINTKKTHTNGQNDPPPKYYESTVSDRRTDREVHVGTPVDHVYDIETDDCQVPDRSRKRHINIYTRVRAIPQKNQLFFY